MARRFGSSRYSGPPAEKNYVASDQSGISTGSEVAVTIADADNQQNDNSMSLRSRLKAVFISSSISSETPDGAFQMGVMLIKVPGGLVGNISNPNGALNDFTQQNCILWIRMSPKDAANAHNFVGWYKIPRRHQIFNESDILQWRMSLITPGTTWSHCSNFVYKWR